MSIILFHSLPVFIYFAKISRKCSVKHQLFLAGFFLSLLYSFSFLRSNNINQNYNKIFKNNLTKAKFLHQIGARVDWRPHYLFPSDLVTEYSSQLILKSFRK